MPALAELAVERLALVLRRRAGDERRAQLGGDPLELAEVGADDEDGLATVAREDVADDLELAPVLGGSAVAQARLGAEVGGAIVGAERGISRQLASAMKPVRSISFQGTS